MKVGGFTAAALVVGVVGLTLVIETEALGALVGLVDTIGRIVFWGLVFLAGARLCARIVRSRLTGMAHLAWDGATGLALFMALVLVVGLIPGGFGVGVVRSITAVVIALGVAAVWKDPVARFSPPLGTSTGDRGVALLLAVLAILGLLWDRVPPVFFDSRAYHFALPELWLVTGRVSPESWSVLSSFPPGMSMLYGVGLATGGEAWANDANLLVGLCLIAMVASLARRLFGPGAALPAAVLTLATPLVFYALAIPGADLAHGLFVFGSLGSLMVGSGERPCWLRRAGILAGGAVLTKYLGLIVPLTLGVAWLLAWPRAERAFGPLRDRFRDALRFAAPAALLLAPWLLANTREVGNPVAPAASSVFATRGLAEGAAETFRGDTRGGLPDGSDLRRLQERWLTGSDEESRIYPTPAWGWLPFALLAFTLFSIRDDRALRVTLGLALVLVVLWFLTFRWERFLVAVAGLVAIASAGGIVAAQPRAPGLRHLPALAVIAAFLSIYPAARGVGRFNGGIRVALGRESASGFIEGALDSARLFRRANALLDPGQHRVLLVGEMRHYGLHVPRAAPTGFNTHPLVEALRDEAGPDRVHRRLRLQGFTHLIVDPGWIERSGAQYPSLSYLREHPERLRLYLDALGAPIAVEGRVALFKIPG